MSYVFILLVHKTVGKGGASRGTLLRVKALGAHPLFSYLKTRFQVEM